MNKFELSILVLSSFLVLTSFVIPTLNTNMSSFSKKLLTPSSESEVWASLEKNNTVLTISQESGVNHIRGFNSSIRVYDLINDSKKVLFESGIVNGLNESFKKLVINTPPSLKNNTVSFLVVESTRFEAVPNGSYHKVLIDLENESIDFLKSFKKHKTRKKEGELIVDDSFNRSISVKNKTFVLELNFDSGRKRVWETTNNNVLVDTIVSENIFFNNDSVLYASKNGVVLKNFLTGNEEIVFTKNDSKNLKAIYGLTNNDEILLESKKNHFFLFNPKLGEWFLITKSNGVDLWSVPIFNNAGNILKKDGSQVLLKKYDSKSNTYQIHLFNRKSIVNPIISNTIPNLSLKKVENTNIEKRVGSRKGMIAPNFTLKSVNGEVLKLSNLTKVGHDSKWVLLYAWATWCPQCSKEFPVMKESFNEINPENIVLIGINVDSTEGNQVIKDYQDGKNLSFIHFTKTNTSVLVDYKIMSTTSKHLIDPSGVVQYSSSGVLGKKHWNTIFKAAK